MTFCFLLYFLSYFLSYFLFSRFPPFPFSLPLFPFTIDQGTGRSMAQ